MDIMHLKYFKVVAEYENMTRATADLHVAQSAVSKVIKGLEEYFGVKLFDRVGKNIVLNENGKILLKHTEHILNSVDSAKQELADYNNRVDEGTVHILMRVFPAFLPELISGFWEKYPKIKLVIMQHSGYEKWDVCLDASLNPVQGANVQTLLLEKIYLALPPQHRLAGKKTIALSDLTDEHFLCLREGSNLQAMTNHYCNLAGFKPKIVMESDTPATFREMILLGLGVSLIPELAMRGAESGACALVTINKPRCVRYINLVLDNRDYYANAVLLFKQYIVDYFKKMKQHDLMLAE